MILLLANILFITCVLSALVLRGLFFTKLFQNVVFLKVYLLIFGCLPVGAFVLLLIDDLRFMTIMMGLFFIPPFLFFWLAPLFFSEEKVKNFIDRKVINLEDTKLF